MSRADLILKLTVGKDKRTVEKQEVGGRISYFWRTFTSNLGKATVLNLIYSGIFALPLFFSLFVLPMLVDNYVYADKSFIGNFGIGFPNTCDSLFDAIHYYHYVNRILVYPCILFSTFVGVVGLSGLFHCSRGLMWGEKVKFKSFFRGIKKLWKPFIVVAAVVTVLLAGMLYGFGWHQELMQTTGATSGSYAVSVFAGIFAVFGVSYLIVLLPSFACYDFKFFAHVKNAGIFLTIMPIPTIVIAGLTGGIFCLALTGSTIAIVLGFLLLAGGFIFFTMMWTTYGQYLFDNFIVPQVDKDGNRVEVQVKKKTAKEAAYEYVGAQKTSTKNKNGGNNGANKKKKQKNTYNSSYKRKK